VISSSPLTQSTTAYSRASQLASRVEQRLEAVDIRTKTHRETRVVPPLRPAGAAVMKNWTRNREQLRQAFIASLIFGPPAGLQPLEER
jgi:hypothetical protein